jgi:hypothetical protein
MLGHEVTFSYCRAPGAELPCRKILDCWWQTFDVNSFLHAHFTDEQIQQALAPPKDKATSIVELIQQARRSQTDQASG